MNGEPAVPPTETADPVSAALPAGVLSEVEALYQRGLCVQAYERTKPFGPLHTWTDCASAIWAGRLASNLGGGRLGRILHWRNFRRHRHRHDAGAYYTHVLLERFGPLTAADFQRQRLPPAGPDTPPDAVVYSLTLRAAIAEAFRDFVSAEAWLRQAEGIRADLPWLLIAWSRLLERQDRYGEALERARASLAENPVYRPGVQQTAHLLQVLDRDEEALALLRAASARMENAAVTAQLATLEQELELHDAAEASYDRCLALAPLAGPDFQKWADANRTAIACRKRDLNRALELARGLDDPFHRDLVQRLGQPGPEVRRVQLPVPFVRQHDMTCAPATLAAVSRFWGLPAEHLSLAEEICYDGTPGHSERHWAETHGYVVREFTVTWEAAVALLDRGVPFTLTTTEVTSGHLQAVIGFDELRRALLIRDPFHYYTSEALCPKFLERYAATGPRGMAMFPQDRTGLLAGVELPDAALYDELQRVNRALHLHRRDDALAALQRMVNLDHGHRLTWTARRSVAGYDANTTALLESIEGLLGLYPDAATHQYVKLGCLGEVARRQERLDYLATLVHQPKADPVFWLSHAGELRADGRQLASALNWTLWALRYRPADPQALKTYADILWDLRDFETATEIYRLASCGNPRHEGFARSYFLGARHLRQTPQALAFLRERFAQLGRFSPWPAITLINALQAEDEPAAALAVLEEARALRPDDGDLLLFASDIRARNGERDLAEDLLARAEGRVQRTAWLRSAAALADYRCDRPRMLAMWREVLTLEPLALDANRAVANLLAETEDRGRALAFLEDVCTRFPGHCGLHGLWADFTRGEPEEIREPVLRRLLEINPADAWAHRELAILLRDRHRLDEALALAEAAIALEPAAPFGFCTRAEVLVALGRHNEARRDCETAVRLAVDTGWAIERLLTLCDTADERIAALAFVHRELVRQVVFGEALFAYRAAARGVLDPATVLARLREAREARPDLWEAWVQEVAQLRDMERLDEALALAVAATEKFPLLPRLWIELAELYRVRLEAEPAIAALEKALAINPANGEASRKLSEVALQLNDFERAREALERACRHAPLDAFNHGCLADVLWRAGRRSEALDKLRLALRLEPGYGWGWQTLRAWAEALNQPDLALDVARELAAGRPGEARSHMRLGEMLLARRDEAAITAAFRAVELAPHVAETHDHKAWVLARFNRIEEALACCRPAVFRAQPPLLVMREAWIESIRGNLPRAVALMSEAVAALPANIWGRQCLADWQLELGDLDGAERTAEQLIQLAPHDPAPLSYAASLNLRQGKRDAAIGRFRRAFRLDPQHSFSGLNLFDLLLEEGDLQGAGAVLETLGRHENDEYVHARQVKLLIRQGRSRDALPVFERLCRERARDGWALFTAGEALVNAGHARRVDRIVAQALRETEPNVFLGAFWVERRFRTNRFSAGGRLRRMVARGELGDRALMHYLDTASNFYNHFRQQGDAFQPGRVKSHADRILRRHADRVQANDDLWGKATFYLVTTHQYRKLARVSGDWRQRKGVEGWMLYNLATGLHLVNRPDEAQEVIRHARGLRLDRELFHAFAARHAFEEAAAGDPAAGGAILAEVDAGQLRAIDKAILSFARSLTGLPVDAANRRQAAKEIRQTLAGAGGGVRPYFMHPIVRRYYWRTIRRLTTDPALRGLKPWAWWNYLGPVGVAIPGLVVFPALAAVGIGMNQAPLIVAGALSALVSALLLKR